MTTKRNHPRMRRTSVLGRSWWAAPAAFLATMMALPASAGIDIPTDPLTTGARVPPNILFILDDSGSMNFVAMPESVRDHEDTNSYGSVQTGLSDNPSDRSFLNNSVYYNPDIEYTGWIQADGTPMAGGMSISSVYTHWNYANGNDFNCNRWGANCVSGTRDLRGSLESVFYMPRAGVDRSTVPADFIRFSVNSSGQVVRAGSLSSVAGFPKGPLNSNMDAGGARTFNLTVSASISLLEVATRGGGGAVDLQLMRPDGQQACRSRNGNGSEFCAIPNPVSGSWQVRVYRDNNATFSNVYLDAHVAPEIAETPTGRSQSDELKNIATWYSYHRTRMKAAKAGASAAFSELGKDIRVGFRTIHKRNGDQTSGNWPRESIPIPVKFNDGLFEDVEGGPDNRTKWYSRLHSAWGLDGTPLHSALAGAGSYFSNSSADGPYGPASGSAQLACRQNFSILTTDGYWNNESGSFGNVDGTAGPAITEPTTGASFTYKAEAPYSDTHGGSIGTLADVAMYYWKNDLRAGTDPLKNIVPTTAANPAFWQHMVTFGLSIGVSGKTGFRSVQEVPPNFSSWPNPMPSSAANDGSRIDDLLHAAVNSRGAFVAASDPTQFTDGLKAALAAIVEKTGSFSNVASNSTAVDIGTRVFQANYVSSLWTGELRSQPVSLAGGVASVDCSGTTQPANGWCASKGIPTSSRKIFTSNGHNDGHPTSPTITAGTAALAFPGSATSAQLESLTRTGVINFPVTGAQNAAYIAGTRNRELSRGGTLRNRNHLLGDIVGSSPAYVQDTETVYVGANDGMLHAFNSATGAELFAFIPGIINWQALGTLSRPDYAHRYFVDGPVVVSSRQQTPGKNLLVAGLGKGGKGLFSLDVSAPASFSASNFKWERAETPGNNMGLIQGRPIIGKVGTTDAVIVSNGVNSSRDRAVLIVLNLETGAVIREIDTGAGSSTLPNGLSEPTAVYGQDGKTLAYVYAGDMLGNVWKFDLTATVPSGWTARKILTATDASGNTQPISGGVTVATHPVTNKRWVFAGTGRYLTTGDVASTRVQGMYGVIEHTVPLTRADLTQRTMTVTTATSNGYPVRSFAANAALPTASYGWFIDLPASGERIVQAPQVVSSFLVTASMIPSGDACESDGSGYINALDAFTGTSAGGSYFDLDRDGDTSDERIGELPVGSVNLGVGMPTLPSLLRGMLVVGGSSGSGLGAPLTLAPRWDRASWREIRRD